VADLLQGALSVEALDRYIALAKSIFSSDMFLLEDRLVIHTPLITEFCWKQPRPATPPAAQADPTMEELSEQVERSMGPGDGVFWSCFLLAVVFSWSTTWS
jgi:hypothetical protein